jgi:hypothetical protein
MGCADSQIRQLLRIVPLGVDINNLGKIGGWGDSGLIRFFVKTRVFVGIAQVRLTVKPSQR